jgi:O-antigen ligase
MAITFTIFPPEAVTGRIHMAKPDQKKQTTNKPALRVLIYLPICIILLAFSSNTVDAVLLPKFVLFTSFILLITLLLLARKKSPESKGLKAQPAYFIAFLLYLLVSALGLWGSSNPGEGIFDWIKIGLFGTGVYVLSIYFSGYKDFSSDFAKAMTLIGMILVLIGLVQLAGVLRQGPLTHDSVYRIDATFGHKNIFCEILFLTFPFVCYEILTGKGLWKAIGSIVAVSSLFLIISLLTRAVWLATGLAFLISLACTVAAAPELLSLQRVRQAFRQYGLLLLLSAAGIGAGICLYSGSGSSGALTTQVRSMSDLKEGSAGERMQMWKQTLRVFEERPLVGVGLGNWKVKVMQYGHSGKETEDNQTFHQRPHNDFLWILSEQGVLGLLAYLCTAGILLYYIVRLLRSPATAQEKLFYWACLYAYCGYLIIACFGFPKERIEHGVILAFVFAIVIIRFGKVNVPNASFTQSRPATSFLLALGGFLLFALAAGISRYQSELHLQKAYALRDAGSWEQGLSEINAAEDYFYKIDPMCTPLSWYAGEAFFNLGKTDAAFEEFKEALEINPTHVHVLNNLATCYEMKGNHESAIRLYKRALAISPNFDDSKMNLSVTLFNLNRIEESYFYFTNVHDTTSARYQQLKTLLLGRMKK